MQPDSDATQQESIEDGQLFLLETASNIHES